MDGEGERAGTAAAPSAARADTAVSPVIRGEPVDIPTPVWGALVQEDLRRIEEGLLADARRVAEAAEFAYRRGAMGLLDLLDARRTQRQVEAEALNARADYARAWAAWTLQANYPNQKNASGNPP